MKTIGAAAIAAILFFGLFFIHDKDDAGNRNYYKEENPTEAYDALTFLTAMNAFPHAEIPKDGYAKAWKRNLEIAAATHAGMRSTWTSEGPNNIGGRTI